MIEHLATRTGVRTDWRTAKKHDQRGPDAVRQDYENWPKADLIERIWLLERELGRDVETMWRGVHFTTLEQTFANMLWRHRGKVLTKQLAYDLIYGGRNDVDAPEFKILDVMICKVRNKLKKFDIEIETVWGRGWSLGLEQVERVLPLIAEPIVA